MSKGASRLEEKNYHLPSFLVATPVIFPDFELTQLFPTDSEH